MNCFQLIKSVLDEAYEQIPGNEAERDFKINDMLSALRNDYSNLLRGAEIGYRDPLIRFAYIYAYVTSHANLVYSTIQDNENLGNIFDRERVNVACIGGGPGSDFLGILKYLLVNQKSPFVRFDICDKERAWAESWHDVDAKVDAPFRISTSYLSLDVTKPDDWKTYQRYFQSDVFTMIYFMSEVYTCRDLADEYFNNLFSQAKLDSFFLFIDNNSPNFYDWFDELALANNINILEKGEDRMRIPFDEDKTDLEIYFEKFSSPKLTANIAYRIGQKR